MATRRLISVDDCPCDGCPAKPCGHPARCVKFALWLNKNVDAVSIDQYNELLDQYNELRENFIDYACSGATNLAPFCKNKFAGCVDRRGWCMQTNYCRGFRPDRERKDNG